MSAPEQNMQQQSLQGTSLDPNNPNTIIKEEGVINTAGDMNPLQQAPVPQVEPASMGVTNAIYSSLPGQYFVVPKTPLEIIQQLQEEEKSLLRVQQALQERLQTLEEEAILLQKTKEQFDAAQGKV